MSNEVFTLAEWEEKYFPERLERLVTCPQCNGELSLYRINNTCNLCFGKGSVKYKEYREYWKVAIKPKVM